MKLNSSGNILVSVNNTTGTGLHAPDGSMRVTVVDGTKPVGVTAADGSTNVVTTTANELPVGVYHPSGALRGVASTGNEKGLRAPNGAFYFDGLFSPINLFSASEQGVWYDPSDLTTMFQDSAGTTPVTAVEQYVGKILDKSGRGNHATQATSTSRPLLSARVNLLTYSEQFDNAVWGKSGLSVTANATTDPLGGSTADLLKEDTASGNHKVDVVGVIPDPKTIPMTFSICAKAAGRRYLILSNEWGANGLSATFDLQSGVISQTNAGGTGVLSTSSITSLGNGWYRCSMTGYIGTGGANAIVISLSDTGTQSGFQRAYAGDGTSGIYLWGADMRFANDGVGIPVYQRVASSTDYDTSSFPLYLKFDGTNDGLATGSINFSTTNKMTVLAGLRKLSDATQSVVAELTASIALNSGAFLLTAPNGAAANYNFSSKGTTQVDNTVTTYIAPLANVVTGQSDISAPSNIIRVNGTQAGLVATSQGTGNYANAALYIGQRSGGTLPFNGRIYSLIVRGAASSATDVSSAETWVNTKTKAY